MPLVLRLNRLGLRYGERWIFRGLSGELRSGEGGYAVVGPNGSGKSSLLGLIAGTLSASEGSIEGRPPLMRLAWQSPHVLPPPLLSLQEIAQSFWQHKCPTDPKNFWEKWQLSPQKRLDALSSGMRQRFLVGLALSLEEGLILLDEPTTFLDTHYREKVRTEIATLRSSPECLILCATNDPEEASWLSKSLPLPSYGD
ncbi:MAG: ABC transporter ATP-binding protein [Bacteroidia bacterium]|nr:ABC transporter ATP-binding protein [Bacteroidia bacterium]MDW8235089.1 ABC transporter ATP-binding protein [Bacteroidia bacterium]